MALQRAATLYPINSTTVDTGTGIDIRALSNTEPGATDGSQSILNSTQGSNSERTFDPATASVTTVNNAATTLSSDGYAIPTADMATVDSNCIAVLAAQNVTVNFTGTAAGTGTGNVGANDVLTPRASLWKWNTSTNTGTLIAGGSGTAITISALIAYSGTAWTAAVTFAIPATTFAANEVLYVQMGGNLACGAGLLGGARTTTWLMNVDVSTTNVVFATSGLRQACTLTDNVVGKGVITRQFDVTLSRSATGKGEITSSKAVVASKTFDVVGKGEVTLTKSVQAQRTFNLVGKGEVTRQLAIAEDFNLTGVGVITFSRVVVASKTFSVVGKGVVTRGGLLIIALPRNVVGKGVITAAKTVQAQRTFSISGKGEILITGVNATTITIPIDEVPEVGGGGTTIIKRITILLDD